MIQWRIDSTSPRSGYPLSPQESNTLLLHSIDLRERIMLELFLFGGLRLGELCKLEIARVHFEDPPHVTVSSKGGPLRNVPIAVVTAAKLRTWIGRRRHGWVFPGADGDHLTDRAVENIVAKAGRRCGFNARCPGLKNLNPGTLRHTCARRMKDSGMPWEAIARVLGHRNPARTVNMYGTLTFDEVAREMEAKIFQPIT